MIIIIVTSLLLQLLACACGCTSDINNVVSSTLSLSSSSLSGGIDNSYNNNYYNEKNVINIESFNNIHDDDDLVKQCSSNNITNGHDYLFSNERTSHYYKDSKRRYQSLICWLYNLKLNIPDEHFRSGIFSVSIHDMVCTAFQIHSISSTYNPSCTNTTKYNYIHNNENDIPSIALSIDGVSATCSGHYKAGLTGGTVTVILETIENTTSIQTDMLFHSFDLLSNNTKHSSAIQRHHNDTIMSYSINAPKYVNVTTCQSNLQVPHKGGISFSGSISAKLIGLFSSSIAHHVNTVIQKEICPNIQSGVNDKLNTWLGVLDDYLRDLITKYNNKDKSHDYDYDYDNILLPRRMVEYDYYNDYNASELISWEEDLSIIKRMLTSFNRFLSSHMNRGFILSFLEKIGWNNTNINDVNHDSRCNSTIDCGFFFNGVNGLIRYLTASSFGAVNITTNANKISFTIEQIGDVTMIIHSLEIDGLDTWTKIEVVPKYERTASIVMESNDGFHFEGSMELNIDPISDGMIQDGTLHEVFEVSLNISSLELVVDLDAGILRERLQHITIGDLTQELSFRNKNETINLLLSSLAYANFTQISPKLKIRSFEVMPLNQSSNSVNELLEASLDETINHFIQLFLREYEFLWTEAIISFGQGPFRIEANDKLKQLISNKLPNSDDFITNDIIYSNNSDDSNFFNFSSSLQVQRIHEAFASETWVGTMNTFIACVVSYIQNHTPFAMKDDDENSFAFAIEDASIQNANRINSIDILKALDETHVLSSITNNWDENRIYELSTNGFNSDLLLKLLANIEWQLLDLKANLNTSASINGVKSQLSANIEYNLDTLAKITLFETIWNPFIFSYPMTKDSGLYDVNSSIERMNFGINITANVANESRIFHYECLDDYGFGRKVTSMLTTMGVVSQNLMNALLLVIFDARKNVLRMKQQNDISLDALQNHYYIWFLSLGMSFLIFNAIYFYFSFRSINIVSLMESKKKKQRYLNDDPIPTSLAFHQRIPYLARIIVPLIIVATIIIFVVSNLSTGASVDLEFSGINHANLTSSISLPNVFTFSLGKTVSEMYQAKVYTLMTLVLVFSGIWPYVKLLVMLSTWISSEKLLVFERRENLLIWLDAFGKYSLVDSFVLVLMLVSFRFHVDLDLPILSVIDSFVIPRDGFYTFLCATVLSLIIGHMVTFLHRYSLMPEFTSNIQSKRESIRNHVFQINHTGQRLMHMSRFGKQFWLIFNILTILLLVIGATQKCFIFEFKGAAGLVLGEEREAHYSLFSLGTALPRSVRDPSAFGIICVQWTYFFFALVMPFSSIIFANILFYTPMTLRNQNRVFTLAEICNAWSAIEVFLLSVLASMLELSQFASFMVGHHCDFVKGGFLKELFNEDDTCFSVQSRLGSGSGILCLGVIMQCIIMIISLRLCHQTIEERIEQEGISSGRRNSYHTSGTNSFVLKLCFIFLFQAASSVRGEDHFEEIVQ